MPVNSVVRFNTHETKEPGTSGPNSNTWLKVKLTD